MSVQEKQSIQSEEFLTVEQVAVLLKVSCTTVYGWAQSGTIKGYKFGERWRFLKSELLVQGASSGHRE